MKIFSLLFSFISCINIMHSQSILQDVPGEYYLSGVMETASGFKLNEDKTFQFFFSQGALDRSGKGTWDYKDGFIEFNSGKAPLLNYSLLSSKKIDNDSITIRLIENNSMLLGYTEVLYKVNGEVKFQRTNSDGVVSFPKPVPDEIILLFYFCPEKQSVFKLSDKDHNYYEFRYEPWLFDIYLDHFKLKMEKDKMTGGHPLMEGLQFNYIKN